MAMNQAQRISKYGNPLENQKAFEANWMTVWDIPSDINAAMPHLPNRLYCNKVMPAPLEKAFRAVIAAGLQAEIKTFDGCYVVRRQRASTAISMHSWGLAIDLNAAWNPLVTGVTPERRDFLRKTNVTWSEGFLDCFRQAGFSCGADWVTRLDGMHFEWNK